MFRILKVSHLETNDMNSVIFFVIKEKHQKVFLCFTEKKNKRDIVFVRNGNSKY